MCRYLILNEKDEIVEEVEAEGYDQMIAKCRESKRDYTGCQAYLKTGADLVTEINTVEEDENDND